MKWKLFFMALLMWVNSISVFAQVETDAYHYNKVYDYENDTIPKVPFQVDSLLLFADRLSSKPYKAGGKTPAGFDCSGFAFYCFRAHSVYLPYSSREQAEIGSPVSEKDALPGDLIFFKGYDLNDKSVNHVGIISTVKDGKIRFIHSSSQGVKYESLESPYYKTRFLKIRRVY